MTDRIVQLQDKSSNNIYPIAGGTTEGAITKTMFSDDAAFIDSVLSTPSSVAYVATDNIQDGAVTSDKIDYTTLGRSWVSDFLANAVTATSVGDIPTLAKASITTNGGDILVIGNITAQLDTGSGSIRFYRTGSTINPRLGTLVAANGKTVCSGSAILQNVPAGTYTISFYWTPDAANITLTIPAFCQYSLTAIELPSKVLK